MSTSQKNQPAAQKPGSPESPSRASLSIDQIEMRVFGSTIKMVRKTSLDTAAELSAFIPRAEFRQRYYEKGQLISEKEIILNSITVVHAPRHPLHQGQGSIADYRGKGIKKRKAWAKETPAGEPASKGFWRKVFSLFSKQ